MLAPRAMLLVCGLVSLVLGLLGAVLFVGLATDQGSSTADDRTFVAVLTGVFLATGGLCILLDYRKHGRRPDLLAIVAGVLVGVAGVVAAAVILADRDVSLGADGGGKRLGKLIGFGAGILPGVLVYYGVRRLLRRPGP